MRVAAATGYGERVELGCLVRLGHECAVGMKAFGGARVDVYTRGAEGFHTDGTFMPEPYKATQLYALAIPSRGGDTHFASMYAAYDALPSRLKERLKGRYGA